MLFVGRDTVEFPPVLGHPILDRDHFPIDNRNYGTRRLGMVAGSLLPPRQGGCFGALLICSNCKERSPKMGTGSVERLVFEVVGTLADGACPLFRTAHGQAP